MKAHTILWRGIQLPGHEACRLYFQRLQWHLAGSAAFADGSTPCLLSYSIVCDNTWRTLSATVAGWVGDRSIRIRIRADENQHWWLNEVEIPAVAGCVDLDLNFSPSTNTIAIHRLDLPVGEKKQTTAAWLRFPTFTLEPLPQSYQRLENQLYRYESNGGRFVADLTVDEAGMVIDYPGIWVRDAW